MNFIKWVWLVYDLIGQLSYTFGYHVFFRCRKGGKVPILYMKVYLVILCSGRLPDKYKYIFNLVADARRQFDELGLTKLFHILADVNVTNLALRYIS